MIESESFESNISNTYHKISNLDIPLVQLVMYQVPTILYLFYPRHHHQPPVFFSNRNLEMSPMYLDIPVVQVVMYLFYLYHHHQHLNFSQIENLECILTFLWCK